MSFKRASALVRDNRKLICFLLLALFVVATVGYLQPNHFQSLQDQTRDSILEELEGKSAFEVTLFIIANNLRVAGLAILLGIILLPLFTLVVNGYFIGAVLNTAVNEEGFLVVWKLLPHGVFEIPALCIAFAFGLRIGVCWFKKDKIKNFKRTYMEGLIVFVCIVLPLIVVAGIVEGMLIWILQSG
jgi:stage II sporulation protein M